MTEKSIIPGIVVLLIAVGAVLFVMSGNETPAGSASPSTAAATSLATTSDLATSDNAVVQLAQCIKESGAVFYGAFWCPHCKRQKELFGKEAMAALAYVECSTPDGNAQTQACIDKKIESYPTWEFKDGTRLTGEQTLAELAKKTSCALPPGITPEKTASSTN